MPARTTFAAFVTSLALAISALVAPATAEAASGLSLRSATVSS
jgi:hypothetical protein